MKQEPIPKRVDISCEMQRSEKQKLKGMGDVFIFMGASGQSGGGERHT